MMRKVRRYQTVNQRPNNTMGQIKTWHDRKLKIKQHRQHEPH